MSKQKDGGQAFPMSQRDDRRDAEGAQAMSKQENTVKFIWVMELCRAKETLMLLRGSIRGDSPSQLKLVGKLNETIQILETHITVEQQLIK